MAERDFKISPDDREELAELAALAGKSMSATLSDAIHTFRRHVLLKQMNAACAVLKSDSAVWEMMQRERAVWDTALLDGMEESK